MSKRIEVNHGDKYGRWTVVRELSAWRSPKSGKRYRMVECCCECGTVRELTLESICRTAAPSQSCGCLQRESAAKVGFRGETMCISEWAERVGLPRKTLEKRLNCHGFTVEEALTLPLRARRASQ